MSCEDRAKKQTTSTKQLDKDSTRPTAKRHQNRNTGGHRVRRLSDFSWLGRSLLAGLLLSLAGPIAPASADDDVMRIGIITDMSGTYADGNGPGSVIAAQLAAEDFGGSILGKHIEIISADHQNKPDVGATIVRDWIDNKHVDVIAEGVNSAVVLAIQNITRARKKAFLISGAGSSV